MNYSNEFIDANNGRILASFEIKARYKPELQRQPQKEIGNKNRWKEKTKSETSLSENLKKWLMAVNIHQFKKTLTEIYELAGFSLGTGSRVNKQAEQKGFVKTVQANLGRGRPRYPILTEEGHNAIGIRPARFYGKGAGLEHILYQHQIELNRKGKFIDVTIETNNSLLAIEVAVTAVHEKENIEKDLEAGADIVVVACKNQKVLNEVQKIICEMSDRVKRKTRILLISELLSMKSEELVAKVNDSNASS
ncbi:MAG: hypothetical protein JRI79_13540 [Deltaproteobacteria bacterium]|nr:hypothetical protein [Deltaproteobacteria bacterium]